MFNTAVTAMVHGNVGNSINVTEKLTPPLPPSLPHHRHHYHQYDHAQEDQDWGIVAMVVDRMFLWVFGAAAVVSNYLDDDDHDDDLDDHDDYDHNDDHDDDGDDDDSGSLVLPLWSIFIWMIMMTISMWTMMMILMIMIRTIFVMMTLGLWCRPFGSVQMIMIMTIQMSESESESLVFSLMTYHLPIKWAANLSLFAYHLPLKCFFFS